MTTKSTNVSIVASADGKTVSIVSESEGTTTKLPLPIEAVGTLVCGLLGAAINCGQKTGSIRQPLTERNHPDSAYVKANGVGLAHTDKPDVVGIVFAFGATDLAIGLSREALQPLGAALLADSADKSRAQ